MNKKQRIFLRASGVIIFFITLLVFQGIFNPEYKNEIRQAHLLCNFQVSGLEVGQMMQMITDSQTDCSKVNSLKIIIDYGWIGYILGIVLFIAGIWVGLGDKK